MNSVHIQDAKLKAVDGHLYDSICQSSVFPQLALQSAATAAAALPLGVGSHDVVLNRLHQ
eukprot:18686-Heterococcus_DN1.PRE.1